MLRKQALSTCPICGKSRFIQYHKDRINRPCVECSRKHLENWIPKEHYKPNDKIMGSLIGKPNYLYILRKCVDCGEKQWIRYFVLPKGKEYRCRHCGIKYMWQTTRKHYSPINKPELGEIRCGEDTNKPYKHHRYIWAKCPDCDYTRWVIYQRRKQQVGLIICQPCSIKRRIGDNHSNWKGGKFNHSERYILIQIRKGDFFYPMANSDGYILEHRLVMAKHLNRCLLSWEIVHHINGIKDDNRIENLQLVQEMQHNQITKVESKIKRLEDRIIQLEAENVLLKSQLVYKPAIELVYHSAFEDAV